MDVLVKWEVLVYFLLHGRVNFHKSSRPCDINLPTQKKSTLPALWMILQRENHGVKLERMPHISIMTTATWIPVNVGTSSKFYNSNNILLVECDGVLGDPCIFPFTWQGINNVFKSAVLKVSKGVEHNACTMDDAPNGVPWCKVGENATHLIYEDCNMETCKGLCPNIIYISVHINNSQYQCAP